jgi:hypothetical protein
MAKNAKPIVTIKKTASNKIVVPKINYNTTGIRNSQDMNDNFGGNF